MESHVSDSIVFIGIASAFSNRQYKCYVEVNFKYDGRSVRKTFESTDERNRSWGDLGTSEKRIMINECLDSISADIYTFALKFTS
jgi:hypothetical protein